MSNERKISQLNKINNSIKAAQTPGATPLEPNELRVTPLIPDVMFVLRAELFDVESSNTTQAFVKATTTTTLSATQATNVFAVQKTADESLIETVIPSGELLLGTVTTDGEVKQQVIDQFLLSVTLKPSI